MIKVRLHIFSCGNNSHKISIQFACVRFAFTRHHRSLTSIFFYIYQKRELEMSLPRIRFIKRNVGLFHTAIIYCNEAREYTARTTLLQPHYHVKFHIWIYVLFIYTFRLQT